MSSLFGQASIPTNGTGNQNNVSDNQPSWFSNQKKRTIPNHLVPKKKAGFQISSSTTSKNTKKNPISPSTPNSSSKFNLLSFGTQQKKISSQGATLDRTSSVGTLYDTTSGDISKYEDTLNETINEEFSLYTNNEDAPPLRSIYDLNDEILISLNKPVHHADSFINKDPKNFDNIFNSSESKSNETKPLEKLNAVNPLSNGESAILVFGYPESMSTQVIQHFNDYGTILEEFEVNKPKKNMLNSMNHTKRSIPIFSGKSWVKITFDNPASATDALQENGSVFNGVLLGVIPYTKDSIEKLKKRKLADGEDIGGGIDLSAIKDKSNKVSENELNHQPSSYITKLDIKDGKEFFLKTQEKNDFTQENKKDSEKLGLFGNLFKYVFGFNEL